MSERVVEVLDLRKTYGEVEAVRGISFHASAPGVAWFVATAVLFTVGMYGAAETLASRVPKQEEYIARVPPWRPSCISAAGALPGSPLSPSQRTLDPARAP